MRQRERKNRSAFGVAVRRTALCAAILFQLFTAPSAMAAQPTDDQHCGKQSKHRDAIKLPAHFMDTYLYPDGASVNEHYSGCQNVWLESGFHMVQAKYKKGVIESYKTWDPKSKKTVFCTYADGRIKAGKPSVEDCPVFEGFPLNKKIKDK